MGGVVAGDVRSVGCIGLGVMGAPMARQLVLAGFDVSVHDPVSSALDDLVAAGAAACAGATEVAERSDVVVLSLPGPVQVASVVEQILEADHLPLSIVDFSTNSVDKVAEFRSSCSAAGVAFVDAPVSGGAAKAKTGELAVMVGGEQDEVALVRPVLEAVGEAVIHVGPSGCGTIAKLVNNQIFLGASVLVQEAFVAAQAMGMSPDQADSVISASSAAPFARLAPLLLSRRFDDVIFRLDIAAKDMALAIEAAESAGAEVPMALAATSVYDDAVAAGAGGRAFHATLTELEKAAGVELPVLKRPKREPRK